MDQVTLTRAAVQQALHVATAAAYPVALIATLRAALEQPEQTCNCRWVGDVQTQQCTLHEAHVDAIHEWAERAKAAEAKLAALQPEPEPVARVLQTVGHYHTGRFVAEIETVRMLRNGESLYTHPPRREWRSLSEGALMGLYTDFDRKKDKKWSDVEYLMRFLGVVQAKLKELNHE